MSLEFLNIAVGAMFVAVWAMAAEIAVHNRRRA
jgi:hypothetical protein